MTGTDLERLWRDPASWRWSVFYVQARDPRLLVPKRLGWTGWTLNFGHPAAWPVLIVFVAVAAGPVLGLLALGVTRMPVLLAGLAASIAAVIALSLYLARRDA